MIGQLYLKLSNTGKPCFASSPPAHLEKPGFLVFEKETRTSEVLIAQPVPLFVTHMLHEHDTHVTQMPETHPDLQVLLKTTAEEKLSVRLLKVKQFYEQHPELKSRVTVPVFVIGWLRGLCHLIDDLT